MRQVYRRIHDACLAGVAAAVCAPSGARSRVRPQIFETRQADDNNQEGAFMTRVITFGTFDVLHIGHVNILEQARKLGDALYVGVSSDELNFKKKGRYPIYRQCDRLRIIGALKFVDAVFVEESLELKREYIVAHGAEILVMGDDWKGRFDEFGDCCKVVYLPRTPSISTTEIIEIAKSK
jgi:glycerol-3-phosphate cytidylyltransferase